MSLSSKLYTMGLKKQVKAKPASMWQPLRPVPGVPFTTDEQGSWPRRLTWAPHLVPGLQSPRPAPAASRPFSPAMGQGDEGGKRTETSGQREMPVRPGERDKLHPEALRTWKGPQAAAPRAVEGGRAPRLAAAGSARWASPAEEAEGKWRPRLCTNHVPPAGECRSAPRAGSKGAGRALTSTPRRGLRPTFPRGTPDPQVGRQGAARSPEAPRPHLARSVAEAGQAQRARPAWGRPRGPGGAWR